MIEMLAVATAEAVKSSGGIPWQTLPGVAVLGGLATAVVYMAKAKLRPRGKFEFGESAPEDSLKATCPMHDALVKHVEETHTMVSKMQGSLDTAIQFILKGNDKQPTIQT